MKNDLTWEDFEKNALTESELLEKRSIATPKKHLHGLKESPIKLFVFIDFHVDLKAFR